MRALVACSRCAATAMRRLSSSYPSSGSSAHACRTLAASNWNACIGSVLPLIRRLQPGQAEHIVSAEQFDGHSAATWDQRVDRNLASVYQPEAPGRCALLEQPAVSREGYMLRHLSEPLDLPRRQLAQESMRAQDRCSLAHDDLLVPRPLPADTHSIALRGGAAGPNGPRPT